MEIEMLEREGVNGLRKTDRKKINTDNSSRNATRNFEVSLIL
jgi:hypothetical protein